MRPGRVCRIRLLLISRRSSCHLSLSLVTLRRHSLVVAGQGFFFFTFVTARFRRDRIKSFLFSSFLGGYTSLSTRSNGNFFSFLCSRLVFSRPSVWFPSFLFPAPLRPHDERHHIQPFTRRGYRGRFVCWNSAGQQHVVVSREILIPNRLFSFFLFSPFFFFCPSNFRDGHVSADSRRSAVGRGQRPSSSEWRDGRNLDGGGGQFSRDSTCFQWRYFLVRNPSGWTTSL